MGYFNNIFKKGFFTGIGRPPVNKTLEVGGDFEVDDDAFIKGKITVFKYISVPFIKLSTSYTFVTLPGASRGQICSITDAGTVTYRANAVGGGSNFALVVYDGSKWIYH